MHGQPVFLAVLVCKILLHGRWRLQAISGRAKVSHVDCELNAAVSRFPPSALARRWH